jgi:hypothetical protein
MRKKCTEMSRVHGAKQIKGLNGSTCLEIYDQLDAHNVVEDPTGPNYSPAINVDA